MTGTTLLRKPWCRPGGALRTLSLAMAVRPQSHCLSRIQAYTSSSSFSSSSSACQASSAEHPSSVSSPSVRQLDAATSKPQQQPQQQPQEQLSAQKKQALYETFGKYTAAGGLVTDELGYSVVSALLTPRPPDDAEFPNQVPDADKELALRVLEYLSLQGTPILVMGTLAMLYQAAMYSPRWPNNTTTENKHNIRPYGNGNNETDDGALSRLPRMINAIHLPYNPHDARSIMTMFFQNGDYENFWRLWRRIPLQGLSRTAEDYVMLFRLHAELGNRYRAEQCVRTWFPMMEREEPPVLVGEEIALLVAECVYLADPRVQDKVAAGGSADTLVQIWDKILKRPVGLSSAREYLNVPLMEYLPSLQQEFDELKPSLFELLAEQQLSALLPPSIRYILAVATHRNPRYLLRILNSYDEIYALLSLLVERYYLRTFGGSFTENFYSLKRERVLLTKNGEIPRAQIGAPGPVRDALKLRTRDVWKNLLIMVGIPYLKSKLDEGYDIHAAPQASLIMSGGPRYNPADDLPARPTLRQRLFHYYKWFLRNIYPSINAGYYFSILAFNLAYLFDNTKYSSPFLWLIGTRIRRLSSADHRAIAAVLDPSKTPGRATASARSRPGASLLGLLSPQNLYPQLLASLRYFLPASIFALKFLEWYHASDFSRQLTRKATEVLDLPAPVTNGMTPPSQRPKPQPEKAATASSSPSPPLKPALKSSSPSSTTTTTPAQQHNHKQSTHTHRQPPVSASSYLPIFTVPIPTADSDVAQACPICLKGLANPTACQTGYVFCYVCVFHWLNGEHQRQIDFMDGESSAAGAPWEEVDLELVAEARNGDGDADAAGEGQSKGRSRRGKWESGRGRCPVTGRRVLGGTEGLRRVLV
ncbi:ubiquitin-protein ligase peroxin 12 [Aspergillus homomorphus CBS 101889]|uniref:Peroxisome assembly protein 12 n=1 Tax=Aspergillus homomorphus (strain CBS 101889) TaxID=1450537 RepID=A0A395I4Z2_ASPHC|nr:hypothetical protein BO97DRAFT_385813 [Aspergillus homomorphus CBS 101889]RAL14845.1 hypothetical protein BO97DRAFT_385813 [Aspergillus homomorphus CBS 101889]